jgi:hypothetical protein
VFSDTFHTSVEEVIEELARRQADPLVKQWVTRVQRSDGKFLVRSAPVHGVASLKGEPQPRLWGLRRPPRQIAGLPMAGNPSAQYAVSEMHQGSFSPSTIP